MKRNYSRRRFMASMASASAALPLVHTAPATVLKKHESHKPRNIIFILSDDHRYDFFGFMHKPKFLQTPAFDRLARQGALDRIGDPDIAAPRAGHCPLDQDQASLAVDADVAGTQVEVRREVALVEELLDLDVVHLRRAVHLAEEEGAVARRVDRRHRAVLELDERDAVVDVAARLQALVDGDRAGR